MANLLNGVVRNLTRGKYAIKVDTNGGTAILNWRIQDGDATEQNLLGDAAMTAPANFEVSLPKCSLTAVITGNATIRVSTIKSYGTKAID